MPFIETWHESKVSSFSFSDYSVLLEARLGALRAKKVVSTPLNGGKFKYGKRENFYGPNKPSWKQPCSQQMQWSYCTPHRHLDVVLIRRVKIIRKASFFHIFSFQLQSSAAQGISFSLLHESSHFLLSNCPLNSTFGAKYFKGMIITVNAQLLISISSAFAQHLLSIC